MILAFTLTQVADTNRLRFANGDQSHDLHPMWLRERTTEPGAVDEGNLQRLFTPTSIDAEVHAMSIDVIDDASVVTWSDGHVQTLRHAELATELGWTQKPSALPARQSWAHEPSPFPRLPWPTSNDEILPVLSAFWELGFVVLTGTPTEPGTLFDLASTFGVVRATNFGTLFDVFSKPNPVDLAYTPMELKAHTDNPYRQPVPGSSFFIACRTMPTVANLLWSMAWRLSKISQTSIPKAITPCALLRSSTDTNSMMNGWSAGLQSWRPTSRADSWVSAIAIASTSSMPSIPTRSTPSTPGD